MLPFRPATWKNGLAFKKINFAETGVPVIKIAELNNGIGGTTAYTEQKFSEDVHLKKGDLLFSWSGNPQTSIDIFRFNLEEGWLNQHIFKVTPDENVVDGNYFYFLMKNLKSHFTQIATNKQTTGLGHHDFGADEAFGFQQFLRGLGLLPGCEAPGIVTPFLILADQIGEWDTPPGTWRRHAWY